MARTQVQYGSKGTDVEELQKSLNSKGYTLDVDGIFGDKTQSAVKDYQQKNGLSVDGIVGTKTWGSLLGDTASPTATSAPIAAPTAKPLPTAPTYDTTTWGETEKGQNAWNEYQNAQNAVNNHGDFTYGNQAQLDAIMQSILNRDEFSYNFNEDAFYQQYKDKYMQQGKMAMADVMGQAAALSGGYGSSYAATAGNQAYQASLQNLNDVIPELYQMAYDRYQQEGQDLYNQYGLLQGDRDRAYGEHTDKYNQLMDALGIARGDYYDGANLFQSEQANKNNIAGQEFNDAMSLWQSENDQAWKQAEWDEAIRQYNEQFDYQKDRDKVADEQWQKQFDASTKGSGGSSGGSSGGGSGSGGSGSGNGGNTSGNGGSNKTSTAPQSVIDKAKGYTTEQGQADYLANEVNKGTITEDQAIDILNQHGVTDLVNRTWEVVDDGGINWFGIGIDADAKVSDGTKTYTLAELRKELQKTMSYKEATEWIKKKFKV